MLCEICRRYEAKYDVISGGNMLYVCRLCARENGVVAVEKEINLGEEGESEENKGEKKGRINFKDRNLTIKDLVRMGVNRKK